MKLTTAIVSAIMALGVAAVPYAEAGNDVDVEARDFSGESLTEFDARSPEEEELETRDEEDDLLARNDYNRCGHGAYEKHGKCYCRDHKLEYNEHKRKCVPKFSCKGDYVKIVVDNYGEKSCKCEREGEIYDEHKGCECPHGQYFSKHWKKCIPKCEHGKEFNGHECVQKCKGKNVELKDDGYGNKKCTCKLENQSYDEHKGCVCNEGYTFNWKEHKCIKDCEHGQEYSWKYKKCYTPCKGRDVKLEWKNYEPTCVCKKDDEVYDEHKGCIDRCPKEHDHWNSYTQKCECDRGYYSRHGKCVKPEECKGYGSYFDKHEWECKCRKDDEKYVEHKGCVDRCPKDNDHWNKHTQKCECDRGYYSRHGKCVKPKECKGYGSYFDKHEWECKCHKDDQKYVEHKGCVDRCPGKNDSWNGHKCVCDHGYESRHGKCVKKCKEGYEYTKWGCKKKSYGGY